MNEYPTKFVSPLLGKRLLDFIHDEENNLKNSLYDLAEELHFFDELAEIYNAWLNQEHALLAGESKYYALCSLARSNIYQACSSYCRQHFSTAMVGARIALDAAFFAEMMAKGYLSEDDYLAGQKKRSGLSNTAKMELKKGKKLGERVPQLLKAMSMLSEHGAHPSPPTWANRIITEDKGIFLSFFQKLSTAIISSISFFPFFGSAAWLWSHFYSSAVRSFNKTRTVGFCFCATGKDGWKPTRQNSAYRPLNFASCDFAWFQMWYTDHWSAAGIGRQLQLNPRSFCSPLSPRTTACGHAPTCTSRTVVNFLPLREKVARSAG
jgi:hypothetical protein